MNLSSHAAGEEGEEDTTFSSISLDSLRRKLRSFADDRDWGKFHNAKNLTMALVSEVGELSELFQWRSESDDPQDWSDEDRENLGRELSDALCCIIRIAGIYARCRLLLHHELQRDCICSLSVPM